jgi:hypothetical protein
MFASEACGVAMTAILMCVFRWAGRWGTSGWGVEILGRSIVARRVGTRQKGGVGGFDRIWVGVWFESWIILGR